MFDEDAESYFNQLSENGIIRHPGGAEIHTKRTIYGTLMFYTNRERLKELLESVMLDFLWQMQYGFPRETEAIRAAANIDIGPDDESEIHVKISKEAAEECRLWAEHAMEILSAELRDALEQTLEHHIEITMVRALLERSGKGLYKFKVDEKKVIDAVSRDHLKVFKERLGARKRGGSSPRWTPERMDELLTLYDSALEMMRGAKEIYRKHKGNKRWGQMVRAAYPELPEDLIERFSGRGQGAEPNELAKEYAARKLDVEVNDYTEKILIAARKRRADNES